MDIWNLLEVVRRRWWAFIIVVVAVGFVGVRTTEDPPQYASSASLLLAVGQRDRPLVVNDPNLLTTAQTLAAALVGDGYGGRLGIRHDGVLYQMSLEQMGANLQHGGATFGPILDLTTIAGTPARSTLAMDELIRDARGQLQTRQASFARASVIRPVTLTRSATPVILQGSRKRALAVLVVLALATGALAARFVDT